MISLDGAVSFSQMNHIAVLIRQNLKFNMARMLYKMFNVHGIVAESHLCLFLSSLETVFKLLRRSGNTHAFSAAAESRLYNNRISDLRRDLCSRFSIVNRILASRNHRNSRGSHGISGLRLISQFPDYLRIRSDKCNVALLAQLCEFAVF